VFKSSIYPHRGDWREAASYKHALEFNFDLDALQLPKGKQLPLKRSFLRIEPESVVLSALKRAEDGDGVILRFYETKGEETNAEITLFREPKAVKAVNLLEQEDEVVVKELKQERERIILKMEPFEIVTLKVEF
jgi:alpha-mannosidase